MPAPDSPRRLATPARGDAETDVPAADVPAADVPDAYEYHVPDEADESGVHESAAQSAARIAHSNVSATERLTRMLYLGIGVTSLVFGALSLDTFVGQAFQPYPAGSTVVWAFIVGLPAVLGFLSHVVSLRVLWRIAIAEGIAFAAIVGWWLFGRYEPLPAGADIPWVLMLSGVPIVTIAIIARPWAAYTYVVLASVTSGFLRAGTSADPQAGLIGLQDALYTLLLCGVLVGLTMMVRRNAARVDAEEHVRRAAESEQAARVARRQERQTINALVHDSVLSTLLMAGVNRAAPLVVARQARSTLEKLDALGSGTQPAAVTGIEFEARLRTQCRQLAADARITILQNTLRTIPTAVMLALLGAAGEALRNSVASAGVGQTHDVRRRVTLSAEDGSIHLSVTDDGVGFDNATVPENRLGIAESIVGRMQRLSGGNAVVSGRPGLGTSIDLFWVRPAASILPAGARVPAAAATSALVTIPRLPPRPLSFSASLGLSVHRARGGVVLYIVVYSVLAAANSDRITAMPLGIFAFLLVSIAALLVTADAADPIPRTRSVGVLVLCTSAAGLMYLHIPSGPVGPFAHWHLGAISLLLVVLVARGRTGLAWAGYAVMALISLVWCVQTGLTIGDGIALVSPHAGTLLVGTLFTVGLRHSAGNLNDLYRERAQRETFMAQTGATAIERQFQVSRLNAMARPSLERLARTDEVTPGQRADFLLVEASLRDAIRARCLFVEPIIGAARAARSRGVDVVLLDDSGDLSPDSVVLTAAIVASELDRLTNGRLTVRVLPPGRPEFATIIVETVDGPKTASRLLLIARDGTVRET